LCLEKKKKTVRAGGEISKTTVRWRGGRQNCSDAERKKNADTRARCFPGPLGGLAVWLGCLWGQKDADQTDLRGNSRGNRS